MINTLRKLVLFSAKVIGFTTLVGHSYTSFALNLLDISVLRSRMSSNIPRLDHSDHFSPAHYRDGTVFVLPFGCVLLLPRLDLAF